MASWKPASTSSLCHSLRALVGKPAMNVLFFLVSRRGVLDVTSPVVKPPVQLCTVKGYQEKSACNSQYTLVLILFILKPLVQCIHPCNKGSGGVTCKQQHNHSATHSDKVVVWSSSLYLLASSPYSSQKSPTWNNSMQFGCWLFICSNCDMRFDLLL